MKLIQRYRRLSLWNKIAFWGSVSSIVPLFLLFFSAGGQSKAVFHVKQSPGAVIQTAIDSPNAIQIGTLNVQGKPLDTRPLKEKIRAYLNNVNPEIVQLLDSGQPSVAVMINTANQPELFELQKEAEFKSYLQFRSTGSVASGAHNTIGGHLNDVQDIGTLNGFEFFFQDKLR